MSRSENCLLPLAASKRPTKLYTSIALPLPFENSSYETKTDTEGAMAQSFANQVGNIGAIVTGISAVVLFMVLLIAASQMSLAVRERTNEIGAL